MGIVNAVIKGFAGVITSLLALLPTSPFTWNLGGLSGFWKYVTYWIPIPEMITELSAYLVAVATWYVIRWVLRFVKYIQ